MKSSSERGHSDLVSDLSRKDSSFPPLSIMLVIVLLYIFFIKLRNFSTSRLLRYFVISRYSILHLSILSCYISFFVNWCDRLLNWFFSFIDVIDYLINFFVYWCDGLLNWFLHVELVLHTWINPTCLWCKQIIYWFN